MSGFDQFPPELREKLERASANISREMTAPPRGHAYERKPLSPVQAEVIRLVDYEGMSISLAAKVRGRCVSSTIRALRRARKAVRA